MISDPQTKVRPLRYAICDMRYAIRYLLFAICALALSACRVAPPPPNGWAIVYADPATGDVGVAGASCSDYPLDYRAVLVPDKGAGVLLGTNSPLLRDRMGAWIEQPLTAQEITAKLAQRENDPQPSPRKYAVVTIKDGKYSSSTLYRPARTTTTGDSSDVSYALVEDGMDADPWSESAGRELSTADNANLTRVDRLMRALEAGSASGGVDLCNQNGVKQTASSAFIMYARHGEPVFQVKTLGNIASREPKRPWLALSISQPVGGRNAVVALREQYNRWRATNLPPCDECMQPLAGLPKGGTQVLAPVLVRSALTLVMAFVAIVMVATIVYLVARPPIGR